MASIQARRRSDDSVSFRVQYRIDKQMRSRSFADPRGAQQFADLIDRVGATAAVSVWESRQERTAGVPTSHASWHKKRPPAAQAGGLWSGQAVDRFGRREAILFDLQLWHRCFRVELELEVHQAGLRLKSSPTGVP